MRQNKFINDKQKFKEYLNLVKKAFENEKRLPEQVFLVPWQRKCVFDFDKAMGYFFWNELK
ncbi:hypothetical protein [Bacillus sp. FJAT-27445]|uniref:hypothetical protein n=1 Tax=Bacillus sp. FJAT-27445 TaxID=1679166 RepID=UPI000743E17F|nr:hypothetical protein [Bacillus sp. FJAT-27445]